MEMFVLLKFLAQLALPPASLAVGLVVAGVLALVGLRRLARLVAVLAMAELLVLSLPPVADALVAPLQDEARAAAKAAPACCYDAIVVLGGGIGPAAPPMMPEPHLTDSADRIWHAARLYHRGLAPRIIVSGGGGPTAEMSEAEAMRLFLTDLGVPAEAIVLEGNVAQHHREHPPRADAGEGRARGPGDVGLSHAAGAAAGANRRPQRRGFPDRLGASAEARASWENWLPSLGALSISTIALREIMANTFDRRGASLVP